VIESRQFSLADAEEALQLLATLYASATTASAAATAGSPTHEQTYTHGAESGDEGTVPILEARYRTLLEQMSAVVFMAYLDRGIGEAYVSPQIEATLGFSQQEWLDDPIRWYAQIHPDEKQRWSRDAADMLLTGKPLRSVYRVIARDGHVVWFQCEAKMVRRHDGRPWFIQGVAFDISDLKQTEIALQDERNVLSAILETVGALVIVFDLDGRVVRFNRACEGVSGRRSEEVEGSFLWDLFVAPDELQQFRDALGACAAGGAGASFEATWMNSGGGHRRILWATTVVAHSDGTPEYVIATGSDETERKRLQKAVLDIGDQEGRRIGQDLHDGLGQHLTGIAFMSKVLENQLRERQLPESPEATKIVELVNEAIKTTRELARGLLPIVSERFGLMEALRQITHDFSDVFRITCRFECPTPVELVDASAATQLCRLAREAISNAIKHGRATQVIVELDALEEGTGILTIRDNGAGFDRAAVDEAGRGLHIMRYRANMIGGKLDMDRGGRGDTAITCVFPLRHPNEGAP